MIEQVRFKNFRALRNIKIDLSPFTLIVGPNASGKTSVLDAIHYLAQLGESAPEALFREQLSPSLLRSFGATGAMLLRAVGTWGGSQATVEVSATPVSPDNDPVKWTFNLQCRGQGFAISEESTSTKIRRRYRAPHKIMRELASSVLLHLDPSRLAKPSIKGDVPPQVRPDGASLASVLADLKVCDLHAFEGLEAQMKSVVPALESLQFRSVDIKTVKTIAALDEDGDPMLGESWTNSPGYEVMLRFRGGGELPAHAASEGTLLTLGILASLRQPRHPRLILIDELERGLHPKALATLVRQIRRLMKRQPDLQIVGTTHSPYLVDCFDPDEVRLTVLGEDGAAIVGTLREHPDFERWKDEMKPGEFWSTVGEDWLRERKEPAGG
jgi:energy-coupling factor transporter ATP-binding protein EcfA2